MKQRHVVVTQNMDGSDIPVLYVYRDSDSEKGERVENLMEFFRNNPSSSMRTKRNVADAVGLFHDFYSAWPLTARAEPDDPRLVPQAYKAFCTHVRKGTDDDANTYHWHNLLKWPPRTEAEASRISNYVRAYFRFLADTDEVSSSLLARFDNGAESSGTNRKHDFSILRHLSKPSPVRWVARADADRRDPAQSQILRFPPTHLTTFLHECFVSDQAADPTGGCRDETGRLFAALLAASGMRLSEGLNCWVSDFEFRGNRLLGHLRHPVFYSERWAGQLMSRKDLLRKLYGLKPRPELGGSQKAGWKGMKMPPDYSADIYWSPIPNLSKYFAELFSDYILNVRPSIMAKRERAGYPDHPYLLVCAEESGSGPDGAIGRPYTAAAAYHAWQSAITRLGRKVGDTSLVPDKRKGTTPHGLRHLYGFTLAKCGFTEREIQEAMRHRSIRSSRAYTAHAPEDIHALLEEASDRIRGGHVVPFDMGRLSLGEALDGLSDRRFRNRLSPG
ncbi:tyrosine-type recombinase/integrase [Aureimonas phyllosphaerae]|uniref:tyrosine-type recombinase/integrase n=1 Tax=Aureimonas phyllosphaerae TaxID=1166078 RepID=UPI003A5B9401